MAQYKWRKGFPSKKQDAQKVGSALTKLEKKHGELTPDVVVDSASSANSALHPHFEWDDTEAAQKFRLEQARGLIRAVVTVEDVGDGKVIEVRSFVNPGRSGAYRAMADVVADEEMDEQHRHSLRMEILGAVRRYNQYEVCKEAIFHLEKAAELLQPPKALEAVS